MLLKHTLLYLPALAGATIAASALWVAARPRRRQAGQGAQAAAEAAT